jgi:hypothetical protein
MFRICNFHISGGSNSKRHLISTNEINLIEFLFYLENFNVDFKMINKSFKNEFFSNSLLDLVNYLNRNKPEFFLPSSYKNNKVILNFLTNNNKLTNHLMILNKNSDILNKLKNLEENIEDKKKNSKNNTKISSFENVLSLNSDSNINKIKAKKLEKIN